MKKLAIIGSGDLAAQVIRLAAITNKFEPVVLYDDWKKRGDEIFGLPLGGGVNNIASDFDIGKFDELIVAIGYRHMSARIEIFDRFKKNIPFATLIHPSCTIDETAEIKAGSILYSGCIVDMNATIGHNIILYNNCVVAHDSNIGDHSILSPSVSIAGFASIGSACTLGIGTIVIDNLTLGSNVNTGAGAVVVNHISEGGLYLGLPAKKVSK